MSLFGDIGDLLTTLANPFGPPSNAQWNLQKGSFKNAQNATVVFFVESKSGQSPTQKAASDQISDAGGRRIAIYEYPYLDGQALDDLGRKPEKFSFNIKFFGANYQVLFQEFINVCVSSSGIGTLTHPVRGVVQCRFSEYEFIHRHDEWNSVSIRATFLEDNTGAIAASNLKAASANSALRSALNALVNLQAAIQQTLFNVTAILRLPGAIKAALTQRIHSITAAFSLLLGQLAATFSSDAQLQALLAAAGSGSVTSVNSGTGASSTLPPVFQVGFSPQDLQNVLTQQAAFVSASQISSSQALFNANKVLAQISTAIAEINTNLGNAGFDAVLNYRQMALAVQNVTQACITSIQSTIIVYHVPSLMSLRMVAFKNGLSADQQNTIEALNPYLASVNYITPGTMLLIPAVAA